MNGKISIQIICIGLLTLLSCKKSNDGSPYSVSYEVITSGGNWHGQYDIYSDSSSQVLWYFAADYPNKWKYSFTAPRNQQVRLVIEAFADSGKLDSANIYVDGKLAITDSGSVTYTLK